MAIAAGLCLLLCLIEGGEAMARTATAASSGWQAAAGTIGGAAAALLAGAAVVAVLTAAVPLRWRPVAGGTVALLAGLQWLVRAVLRLRGQVLVAQPGVAQKVLGGGGEAVIVTAALGAVVVPGGAPLVVGGAAGT
ncbi:MAG TPA: hypothetical protein VGS19_03275, partial [Streptosporangiaceae bacterium]|nr:hypothetical protein [Streptosporangiaceae bacterium]